MKAILSVLLCGLAVSSAQAAPVTFEFAGTGTGSLGGTDFVNDRFVVGITADTNNINNLPNDLFILDSLSGNIDISNVGTVSFTEPLYVFTRQPTQVLGFGNNLQADLIDLFLQGVGIDTYDLSTSFGPIQDFSPFDSQFTDVATSGGLLTLNVSEVTFTAVVPEPATATLLCLGLAAALCRRRVR